MIDDLKAHYQNLFAKSGDSVESVQYPDTDSQRVRFSILSQGLAKNSSIIDLGCGLADMLPFLRENGFTGRYLGCDFVPDFITLAKQKYANDDMADFLELNILADEIPSGFDHVLISGIFNNKIENNLEFISSCLSKCMPKAEKSVRFNALSDYVEYKDEHLFYISPVYLFDYCKKNLTAFVNLKHDYLTKPNGFPYEFTMTLSHQGEL